MRLYHHPFSMNARRAVVTAFHLGSPVEMIVVDLPQREHLQPQFLAMNPNHKVPVLVDGDFKLWESHAIMQYLADKTPGQSVYPTDVRARADVNRWLFWCAQHFTPPCGLMNFENAVKSRIGLGAPDPLLLKRGETEVSQFAGVLDAHLAGREWVCGASLTLADLALAAPLADAAPARLPVALLVNLQRWFRQVRALPAWKKAVPD